MLMYNVAGYMLASHPVEEKNLLENMQQKLQAVRKYAAWSICTKVAGFAGIITFFVAGIQWNTPKYFTLLCVVVIMAIQAYIHWKIWSGRINRIRQTVEELSR
jgi:hypothetical protein